MSDNEYEPFEITDYDLENEFNINRPRRNTKNQQIYGIWAKEEDSDDDAEGRPSFKGSKKPKNYSAPIGFVAGGVQQAGKKKEEEKEEDDDNDEETKNHLHGSSSSSDDEPRMSSFKGDILAGITDEIAGLRKKRNQAKFNPVLSQRGVGTWEKHTKGIGAKLLLQMGYQPGKGLGKDLQGIQAPIEAKLRKGRGAIGAYGPEKGQKIAEVKPEGKKDLKDGDKVSQWRKSDGSKAKSAKYVYKSIEDVLDQSLQGPVRRREFNELTKVKVIDMTGPEQRVLSGYHAISGTKKPTEDWEIRKEKEFKNFQLPELQHNLNLLVDMCEQDIIQSDRALRYNEDRIVSLENEVTNLQKVTQNEETIVNGLQHVLNVLEHLTSNDESLTLKEIAESYEELQEKYTTEYVMYDLASLAPALVRPLLKTELASWDPLKEPARPADILVRWRRILDKSQSSGPLAAPTFLDPYHRLLWDAWMPCIRIAVNAWNVKSPEAMVELLQTWQSLIPSWILDNILQQLIMPRIQHTADEWNPLTDTIPVHTWLHPWLPQLGKRLRVSVFPVIRQKLASALTSWHPSDSSARLMIQPWISVFSQQELDTFLINNILPKLAIILQEFVINPAQQSLDGWNWVMDWVDVVAPAIMADLLDKSFFPRWLQVLTMWLNMSPNYDQVTEWYSGWKALIPPQLKEQQQIKDHFRTALDLMSRSVGGPVVQPPPVQAPPPPIIHSDTRYQSIQQGMVEAARSAANMVEGFKELVQKRCEERGIIFLPMPNRFKEGKQIYRCGLLQMYIDRNVIFANDGTNWSPISLQVLMDKAVGSL